MQVADPEQLLDCLSANELLNALKMLKKINNDKNEELELSFNQSSTSLFNTMSQHQQQQHLDFQLYMAKKQENKPTPSNKAFGKKSIPNKNTTRTPMKQINKAITPRKGTAQQRNQVTNFKSRSHSPITQTVITPRKTMQNHTKQKKQEKQNNPIPESQKQKISQKSRQILQAKSKKGQAYVPIHQRQNRVIKEKQEKIAKLQRMNMTQKELEDRECTFKPVINEYRNSNITSKVSTHNASFMKNRRKQQVTLNGESFQDSFNISRSYVNNLNKSIQQQHENVDTSIDMGAKSKITQKNIPKNRETSPHSSSITSQQPAPSYEPKQKKYKNSKFNILLDLIH